MKQQMTSAGWGVQAAEEDGNMFFKDRPRPAAPQGNVNREYISLFSDHVPALAGRTPMQCYTDFMVPPTSPPPLPHIHTHTHTLACTVLTHMSAAPDGEFTTRHVQQCALVPPTCCMPPALLLGRWTS